MRRTALALVLSLGIHVLALAVVVRAHPASPPAVPSPITVELVEPGGGQAVPPAAVEVAPPTGSSGRMRARPARVAVAHFTPPRTVQGAAGQPPDSNLALAIAEQIARAAHHTASWSEQGPGR